MVVPAYCYIVKQLVRCILFSFNALATVAHALNNNVYYLWVS